MRAAVKVLQQVGIVYGLLVLHIFFTWFIWWGPFGKLLDRIFGMEKRPRIFWRFTIWTTHPKEPTQ